MNPADQFVINGRPFSYSDKRASLQNERAVEVPLGRWFLDTVISPIEIGAVMPYYGRTDHSVIDPYDPYPNAIRQDARDRCYFGENVLSISTIEHVGHNVEMYGREGVAPQAEDENAAAQLLERIVEEAGFHLITWPIGFHQALDAHMMGSTIPRVILRRVDAQNAWIQHDQPRDFRFLYNEPWPNGNAICIVTNIAPLLREEAKP